jgi:hypothetical protein
MKHCFLSDVLVDESSFAVSLGQRLEQENASVIFVLDDTHAKIKWE